MKSLGKTTKYKYNKPDANLLDVFICPASKTAINGARATMSIVIRAPEFTSLCPLTGQPDFATIHIEYIPDRLCVESKSLKLYLGSFRMHGDFHESCVNRICNDLVKKLQPRSMLVRGEFTPRGGIPFWPTSTYMRRDIVH